MTTDVSLRRVLFQSAHVGLVISGVTLVIAYTRADPTTSYHQMFHQSLRFLHFGIGFAVAAFIFAWFGTGRPRVIAVFLAFLLCANWCFLAESAH
jgi:hypothetical protein